MHLLIHRESYHVDPLHHHPAAAIVQDSGAAMQAGSGPEGEAHNRVIYRASDVEYDKVFSQCHSGSSARLRSLQVKT